MSVALANVPGVSSAVTIGHGEDELLSAARTGDGDAFRRLVAPHLPVLHVHCYRMLGSYHDTEEAMQDVLLRAWRSLDTYQGHAPLRHWLYRIATTTCLKVRSGRAKLPASVAEIDYLEPYPDRLLDALPADADPAAVAERRESVSLAFVSALQLLPPTQRAVLIMRDVLAWRGDEVARLLDTSLAAVNSALQRARATLRRTGGQTDGQAGGQAVDEAGSQAGSTVGGQAVGQARGQAASTAASRPLDDADRQLLAGFVDAWQRRDIDGLAALLCHDVAMRMPPEPMEFFGRTAVVEFLATVPAGGALETIRLAPTRANGQPALAAFEAHAGGAWQPYGLMVFETDGDAITTIVGFPRMRDRVMGAFAVPPP